jgi:hypothetical protein
MTPRNTTLRISHEQCCEEGPCVTAASIGLAGLNHFSGNVAAHSSGQAMRHWCSCVTLRPLPSNAVRCRAPSECCFRSHVGPKWPQWTASCSLLRQLQVQPRCSGGVYAVGNGMAAAPNEVHFLASLQCTVCLVRHASQSSATPNCCAANKLCAPIGFICKSCSCMGVSMCHQALRESSAGPACPSGDHHAVGSAVACTLASAHRLTSKHVELVSREDVPPDDLSASNTRPFAPCLLCLSATIARAHDMSDDCSSVCSNVPIWGQLFGLSTLVVPLGDGDVSSGRLLGVQGVDGTDGKQLEFALSMPSLPDVGRLGPGDWLSV